MFAIPNIQVQNFKAIGKSIKHLTQLLIIFKVLKCGLVLSVSAITQDQTSGTAIRTFNMTLITPITTALTSGYELTLMTAPAINVSTAWRNLRLLFAILRETESASCCLFKSSKIWWTFMGDVNSILDQAALSFSVRHSQWRCHAS